PTFYETPTVIVFQKQLPPTTRGHAKKAIWLETIRNSPEGDVRRKSQNFLNSIKGRFELPSLKDTEGIFLNENGYVAEGVTSNVFWVTNGVLYTPSIRTGILPGTTRAFLLTLAAKSGIPVKEGFYGKEDVKHADELFVTNAIQELIPITEINGVRFAGAEGAMYRALHERYVNEVNKAKEGGN
ncbi:MAG TPA: aminotransferase class IV, partial [Sporosarcina sp.]|nr:aminotransferase class IV [Sporosarcina sp.]